MSFHFAEYACRLAYALSKCEGIEVLLFLDIDNVEKEMNGQKNIQATPGFSVCLLRHRQLKNPLMILNAAKIIRRIREFRPDVIHCQEVPRDYLMGAFFVLRRYPWVVTIHDHLPHSGAYEGIRSVLYRKLLKAMCDRAITHGEMIRQQTEASFPRMKGKVFSVEHGVLGETGPLPDPGWERGVLLFFGRIEEYKGLPYFLEAVRILKSKNLPLKAVIAGTGQGLRRYRTAILSDTVFELHDRFIPRQEIAGFFQKANIIVMPYTDATQSGVAAMSLQFGRPAIATDVGGIGEMIRDNYNGLLVPPRNPIAIAEAAERLIRDQPLSKRLAANARALGRNEFSWERVARKTLRIYQDAVRRKGHGADT